MRLELQLRKDKAARMGDALQESREAVYALAAGHIYQMTGLVFGKLAEPVSESARKTHKPAERLVGALKQYASVLVGARRNGIDLNALADASAASLPRTTAHNARVFAEDIKRAGVKAVTDYATQLLTLPNLKDRLDAGPCFEALRKRNQEADELRRAGRKVIDTGNPCLVVPASPNPAQSEVRGSPLSASTRPPTVKPDFCPNEQGAGLDHFGGTHDSGKTSDLNAESCGGRSPGSRRVRRVIDLLGGVLVPVEPASDEQNLHRRE